jgi:GT2 family glycosyltransferase
LFNTILKNTPTPYRLIVIDDCSTDERVYPFLEKVAQIHGHTVLLRHDENRGFICSVNRAFQEVKNHFVILNTDVEVPYNWLGRLMRPIMESHNIATTTPFSNSASICSFPHFCQDNEMFEGLPVSVIDKVFTTLADMEPVDIPTGVGFCMGVNLNVAKKIGVFDPIYGKGYGEENDMCMRATALSYRNVMVPNLFVYHKHGGSFETAEKQKLLKKNLKILYERHNTYESLVKEFIEKDPLRPLRELFVVMVSCNCLGKKIRLLIDHDIGGGANQYRNRLIENYIADEEPVLLLTFDRDGDSLLKLIFYYMDFVIHFILNELSELKDLARLIRISEIFYNNAVTYPNPISVAELISELKDLTGAHLTVSWHDFFPVCPSYTLLNDKGRFCDIPDLQVCASCLKNHEDKDIRSIEMPHWRKVWGRVLEKSDTLLCFSENTAALVKKAYGGCDEKIEVHPHSLYNFSSKIPGLDFSEGLHVGILGNINYQKGLSNIFDLAMEIERTKSKTRLTVIGNIDSASCHSNITVTGTYIPSELPEIIEKRKINVFLFPSIWPETFSYVTEEIMAMKMPVVCFNLGAPADRVKKYELGRILGSMKANEILAELHMFYGELPGLIPKNR